MLLSRNNQAGVSLLAMTMSLVCRAHRRGFANTGRRAGEFKTPFGTIEFTHTKRNVIDILDNSVEVGRPLRLATQAAAYRDLKQVGRNLHLVDIEVLNDHG